MIGNRISIVIAMLAITASAHAEGPSAADQTLAQSLFDEGVKLMDAGRFSEACPKLAESQRLDPGGGTLINLGYCRQNEGRLASAWEAYNEALSQAIKDHRTEREATARAAVNALSGRVAKLVIDVSEAARHVDQIEIRIDGTAVRQAAWGVLSPIDRGDHAIVVTAPGKREWHTAVRIADDGAVQHVSIPGLEDAPVVVPVDHDRGGTERRGWAGQSTFGWVIGGIGVAFLGVGVASGVLALNSRHQSDAQCPMDHCTQSGVDLNNQAKTYAWLSDFGVGLAVVAIGTGILLIATSPKTHVTPVVGTRGAGLALSGAF